MTSHSTFPLLKWGHLTRFAVGRHPERAQNDKGDSYETGLPGPAWWGLRCDCGHEFTILEKEFPGKRVMVNCGRPECAFAKYEKELRAAHPASQRGAGRPRLSQGPSRPVSIYFPLSLIDEIEQIQKEHPDELRNFSHAVVVLVTEGYIARRQRKGDPSH